MATLTINSSDVDLVGNQYVKIQLVDRYRNPITGGFVQETRTGDSGTVAVSLDANAADQYYLVTVGQTDVLISKSASSQTLVTAAAGAAVSVPKVWVPATAFAANTGSPVIGVRPGWLLDAAAEEIVGTVLAGLPAGWTTFDVDAVWVNTAASSGNVVFRVDSLWATEPEDTTTLTAGTPVTVAAPVAAELVSRDTIASGIAMSTKDNLFLRVSRKGDAVADTLANDVSLLGVFLVKAS